VLVRAVDPQHGLDGPLLAVKTGGKGFGGLHAHARMKPELPEWRKTNWRDASGMTAMVRDPGFANELPTQASHAHGPAND
jgi:hypothetical protein